MGDPSSRKDAAKVAWEMQFRDVKEGSTGFDANHPLNDATLEQFAIKNSIGQIISARFPRIIQRRIESLNNFSFGSSSFDPERSSLKWKPSRSISKDKFYSNRFISSRLVSLPKSFNRPLFSFFVEIIFWFRLVWWSKWLETYITICNDKYLVSI